MLSRQAQQVLDDSHAHKADTLSYCMTETLQKQREDWESAAAEDALPEHMTYTAAVIGGMSGDLIRENCARSGDTLILHFHGGGLTQGSAVTHRKLGALISAETHLPLFIPDYPLAPEHPFPAALDACTVMYTRLLRDAECPQTVIFGGDSSGGGLACAVLMRLIEESVKIPKLLYLLSPMLDNTLSGASIQSRRNADPRVFEEDLRVNIRYYCGSESPAHPAVSPLFGNPAGFPPVFIQTGTAEILLDDSTRFAEALEAVGIAAEADICEGMWHVFQSSADTIPEAAAALRRLGEFIGSLHRFPSVSDIRVQRETQA